MIKPPISERRIETERLILRPFAMDDAQAMFDNWASDAEVTKFLTWPAHGGVAETRAVLADWVGAQSLEWAIVPKDRGEPVGSISVVRDAGDEVEVGYCLSRACWGKGYAPEALRALLGWLFAHGARRAFAKHDLENPNSGRVMQKAGMRYLETRAGGVVNGLGKRDVAVYVREREADS